MKTLLVIVPLTILLAGCSRPQTTSSQNTGGVDPIYKRSRVGHFLMDADYLGTEIGLTTGATDVSLDVLHAMQSRDLKQVLAIIRTHRSVLEKAVSMDAAKVKAMGSCTVPNGITEAERNSMLAVCKYSTEIHTEQAAAFRSLLEANDSNVVSKLNAFMEHQNKQNAVSQKAEAEARSLQN